jgi:hypothetical protein
MVKNTGRDQCVELVAARRLTQRFASKKCSLLGRSEAVVPTVTPRRRTRADSAEVVELRRNYAIPTASLPAVVVVNMQ